MTSVSSDQPARGVEHPRWHLSLGQLLLVAGWCLGFYLLNRVPLGEPDLWGHVARGRWLLEHRALPLEDPLTPLLGLPLIDSAWLSEALLGGLAGWGGGEALSLVFAVTTLAAYLTLARTFYLQTRNLLAAHLGVLLVAAVGWSRTATARPEMFGTLCLALLLWLLVRDRVAKANELRNEATRRGIPWGLWIGVPLLMALWANLYGSFVCGLVVVTCWAAGLFVETAWRERGFRAVLADQSVRRAIWVCELAWAATCLNPYGVQLLLNAFWFADYQQLRELPDWRRLVLLDTGGRELAASLAVLMVVLRCSRRRIPVADVLWIAAFSLAFAGGLRMAWWYAAVFGVVVTPHLADLCAGLRNLVPERGRAGWARRKNNSLAPVPRGEGWGEGSKGKWRSYLSAVLWGPSSGSWLGFPNRSWCYSLIALVLLWIALAVSPAGTFVGSRDSRPAGELYSAATPWKLSGFLRENPPSGLVFNPDWWGDWLTWDGPPRLAVFITSNLHLAPRAVMLEYRIVRETRAGWDHVLNRYPVETVVVDKRRQRTLLGYLRGAPEWQLLYEDELGAVLGRVPREELADQPRAKPAGKAER